MGHRRLSGERGFTLLEVIIALGVIAISLFAALTMILHTSKTKDSMREQQIARETAAAKLEEIKAHPFNLINATYSGATFPVSGLTDPTNVAGNFQGRGTVSVDASNPNLFEVQVTVTWRGQGGAPRSYSARNMYTR